ncbi:uncharacterized protein N7506_006067 [Penicillium brevicompactum]|uniref:uncharacterized protein n=1 Tax=Penicillium brevicompactum TaxID=5074 RepID=UPI002540F17E|nr:uncharacterized protein N7506_006067 [Penicillium brevicompactum]KAJ5332284.1 hypothetical protein N7506_006067 [Penicillium brevicompactum]
MVEQSLRMGRLPWQALLAFDVISTSLGPCFGISHSSSESFSRFQGGPDANRELELDGDRS